jgi:hypothetical protein
MQLHDLLRFALLSCVFLTSFAFTLLRSDS